MRRQSTELLSTRSVGGLNRAAVLRALVVHGPCSRSELARLADVTRATIGTIVQGLLDDGLLHELDAVDGRVGKPARPLWFVKGAGTVAAIELRRRYARGALVDASGHIDHPVEVAVDDPDDGDTIRRTVVEAVAVLQRHRPAIGVGISMPGTCDVAAGEVMGSLHLPGAVDAHLGPTIAAATGLAVRVENNTRAEALAEHWIGRGRRVATFATLQTGVGLGAGIVLEGVIHRGPRGYGGEVGHTAVVLDGERCPCGKRGCWETIATLRWLRRAARARGLKGSARIDAARLVSLAEQEPAADDLLAEYADHLAIGIANLHETLGIPLFIVHGDAVGGGAPLRERIRAAVGRRATGHVDVHFSELTDASLLGAASVVLTDLLHTVSPETALPM